MRIAILLLLSLVAASPASALLSLAEYQQLRKASPNMAISYVTALGSAYGVANSTTKMDNGVQLFCAPIDLRLGHEQFATLIETEVQRTSPPASAPIEVILLSSLQREFSCQRVAPKANQSVIPSRSINDPLADPAFVERVARANGLNSARFFGMETGRQAQMVREYLEKSRGERPRPGP